MHELSIAQEIIEIAVKNIPPENLSRVKKITIQLGEFNNIMPESLLFSFNSLLDSSPIPRSYLEIETVPLTVYCNICKTELEIKQPDFSCSKCGGTDIKIISGMELYIKEIELDDEIKEEP